MRGARTLVALVGLGAVGTAGCELVTSFEAAIVDAGPDALPMRCLSGTGCVECDPALLSPCPTACDGGSCTDCDSGDCDPLPAARDPWPAACNALEYAEDFSSTPQGWGRSYDELFIRVERCGLLQWTCPPHHTIWTWLGAEDAARLDPAALVETGFVPSPRGSWALTLGANVASDQDELGWPETQGRSCVLEHDETRGYVLRNQVIDTQGTRHERNDEFRGQGYAVMQSWIEGSQHLCRVLAEHGDPLTLEAPIEGAMPAAGTVKLALVNRDEVAPYIWFWIDYVRVFAPPPG